MTPITLFWYCVLFLWATYLPYGSQFAYNYIRHRKDFTYRATGVAPAVDDSIIFQITTKSVTERPGLVKETVERVREACSSLGFTNFSIRILSDDPRDESNLFGVDRVMVTPGDYETDAVRKGRSMQYAVETYRCEPGDKSKTWIMHLDEESVMLPQTLEAVLAFIASGRGTLAEGPIFYPSVFSKNPITRIADAIRSATCYFCVGAMSGGKAPSHIHGSNLLVRMDVECDVGWALGRTIAEDQLFGLKVFEKYPRMGWHGGVVLETSPSTVKGMLAQRKRWVVGTMQNWEQMPPNVKKSVAFRLGTWGIGLGAALVSVPLWLLSVLYAAAITQGQTSILGIPHGVLDTPFVSGAEIVWDAIDGQLGRYLTVNEAFAMALGLISLTGLLIWMGGYLLGFIYNHSYQFGDTKLRAHLKDVAILTALLPVIGVLENYPLVKGLVEYKQGKADWVVTPK